MMSSRSLREKLTFRYSPLLDMALSHVILENPERFGPRDWVDEVFPDPAAREAARSALGRVAQRTDLFGLALELEETGRHMSIPSVLTMYGERDRETAGALKAYWEALSPYIAARMHTVAKSLQEEQKRAEDMDAAAFLCSFSDRIRVIGDGGSIILRWGRGMRVPLADLNQILMMPSLFCPRRLMFYRLGPVQIFFYSADSVPAAGGDEPPESLVLGYSALAEPTRLKLLKLIAGETLPAREMARRLDLNESTVSRHLRILVEAGLISQSRQTGKFIYYTYQEGRAARLAASLVQFIMGFDDDPGFDVASL